MKEEGSRPDVRNDPRRNPWEDPLTFVETLPSGKPWNRLLGWWCVHKTLSFTPVPSEGL